MNRRRLVADKAWSCLTSELFMYLGTALALGLLVGFVIGTWGGPLR